jgi:sulfur carrier protein
VIVVTVNGSDRSLQDGATVAALVVELGADPSGRGVAVALGGEIVPRSQWEATELLPGAIVEVLIAVQGG